MLKLPKIENRDTLFFFLIHIISDEFKGHAILKGGMVLRLLGSKRETIDLDYTMIPYKSKNDVLDDIKKLFTEIEGIDFEIKVHSKMIRVLVTASKINVQVEINVAQEIKIDVISTASLKDSINSTAPKIIKIMSLDVALAHKLAAWNERRLVRDLYDVFYLYEIQNIFPDKETINHRLDNINSRIPALKKIRKMTIKDFLKILKKDVDQLTQKNINSELESLLDETELSGLSMRMKNSINRLITYCSNSND